MLSDVEKNNNLMLTTLTPVATLVVVTFYCALYNSGFQTFVPRPIIATHYNATTPISNSNKANAIAVHKTYLQYSRPLQNVSQHLCGRDPRLKTTALQHEKLR